MHSGLLSGHGKQVGDGGFGFRVGHSGFGVWSFGTVVALRIGPMLSIQDENALPQAVRHV